MTLRANPINTRATHTREAFTFQPSAGRVEPDADKRHTESGGTLSDEDVDAGDLVIELHGIEQRVSPRDRAAADVRA